jgi:hypothetical protein
MIHDVVFTAYGDKFSVFGGKGFGHAEIGVNGIDFGVVDDEVHGSLLMARGHK